MIFGLTPRSCEMLIDRGTGNLTDFSRELLVERVLTNNPFYQPRVHPHGARINWNDVGGRPAGDSNPIGDPRLLDRCQDLADLVSQLALGDLFVIHATSVAPLLHQDTVGFDSPLPLEWRDPSDRDTSAARPTAASRC